MPSRGFSRGSPPIITLLLAACGSESANVRTEGWPPDQAWRLELHWRIGGDDAEGPAAFGSVAGIATHDGTDRVYVLDRQAQEIRAFSAAGDWVRTFGRPGRGPGEFAGANGIAVEPGTGHVWVVDAAAGRYTVFDSTGALLATARRPQRSLWYGFTWIGRFTPDGLFWDYDEAFLRLDTAVGFVDTLPVPAWQPPRFDMRQGNRVTTSFAVPFAPRAVVDLSPAHRVAWARSDRYEILQLGPRGDTTSTITRAWTPVPIGAAERDAAMDRIRTAFTEAGQRLDESLVPTHIPALWGFTFDTDGHLWVRPLGEPPRYDVFDPHGTYLGAVSVPGHGWRAGRSTIVTRNWLTRVINDSLGSQMVERFRIVRPDSERARP